MLLVADELGDELRENRKLLSAALFDSDEIRRLSERYCTTGDACEVLLEMKSRPVIGRENAVSDALPL